MYAGLSILFFFLFIFLQQVAGYSASEGGADDDPLDPDHVRALTPRRCPRRPVRARLFMTGGPLVAAAGILLFLGTGLDTSYLRDLLPALVVFSLGLAMTVAPLTATVLSDADETDAGIASAINNAIARVAGLIGISAIGAVVAGQLAGDTFAANDESVAAFHKAIMICAVLVAAGGVVALFRIEIHAARSAPRAAPEASLSAPRNQPSRATDRVRRRRFVVYLRINCTLLGSR